MLKLYNDNPIPELDVGASLPRLTPDPVEPKANLLASLPGRDGNLAGGIILSGHTEF